MKIGSVEVGRFMSELPHLFGDISNLPTNTQKLVEISKALEKLRKRSFFDSQFKELSPEASSVINSVSPTRGSLLVALEPLGNNQEEITGFTIFTEKTRLFSMIFAEKGYYDKIRGYSIRCINNGSPTSICSGKFNITRRIALTEALINTFLDHPQPANVR